MQTCVQEKLKLCSYTQTCVQAGPKQANFDWSGHGQYCAKHTHHLGGSDGGMLSYRKLLNLQRQICAFRETLMSQYHRF